MQYRVKNLDWLTISLIMGGVAQEVVWGGADESRSKTEGLGTPVPNAWVATTEPLISTMAPLTVVARAPPLMSTSVSKSATKACYAECLVDTASHFCWTSRVRNS